jgi:disulfide bond formation protein DsbB
VTHDVIVALAVLGVAGQASLLVLALLGALALVGIDRPFAVLRAALEGYELWLAFVVAAVATGGSLFFSEIAGFVPCELCWYQRICMFPLSILTLLIALADDLRAARYLLPLPLAGACVAIYQLLIEHGVVREPQSCSLSAPGGCATKWIDEFGYVTIPALTLTGFLLVGAFLLLGWLGAGQAAVPVEA